MNWVKRLLRPRIVVVSHDEMTDAQMDEAIGGVADTHPLYRAFMQVLDQFEAEAHEKADEDLYVPRALEAHTGGAKYIRAMRANILERRRRKPEVGTRKSERVRERTQI